MKIFTKTDYREILRTWVEERKKLDSDFTYQNLAKAIKVQKPYLSKVLKGNADLNHDQLYLACEFLKLSKGESEYMRLLLEYSRSSLKSRKENLLERIKELQMANMDSSQYLSHQTVKSTETEMNEYYLKPLTQIVHICLSIERYQEEPGLLSKDLAVRKEMVYETLETLERIGMISRKDGKVKVLVRNLHLPRESNLYQPWRDQLRLMSLQRMQLNSSEQSYGFSLVFSADNATKKQIQTRFLDFLKEVDSQIQKAPYEDAFQLNFDLFSWTKTNSLD